MLRIEGNGRSGVIAPLLAMAAVLFAWIASPAPASATPGTQQWVVTGPEGGPFTPTTGQVDVTNTWNKKLRWYAVGDTSWLRITGFNGVVKPGQTKTINLGLNEAVANTLKKGDYNAYIAFRDPSTGKYVAAADLTLSVQDPNPPPSGQLEVTPGDGLTATGQQGGTFSPLSKTYTLTNRGTAALNWRAGFDTDWAFTPGASSGQLQPGASTSFEVRFDPSLLAGLSVGQHPSMLRFRDTDQNTEVATRDLLVDVKSGNSGWTPFTKSSDTRVVYVSSSQGNDSNDGLSESSPKKSLGAGISMLRNGFPDWMLLKKGDTFYGDMGSWSRSGRSQSEPMLISSYGNGERPFVRPGAGNNFLAAVGGNSPHDFAIVDLHIAPQGNSGTGNCFGWYTGGGHMLVEGCLIEHFEIGFVLQGGSDFSLRRNVIVDCTGQGMYVSDAKNILIEENLFDHMGLPNPDVYKHGIYIDNEGTSGMVVRGNIITDTSSHGLQLRPGGVVEDNLFARNAIALLLGGGDSWQANPNGVVAEARRNVILDQRNIDSGNQRGWGIEMKNIASADVTDNILANSPSAGYPRPVIIGASDADGRAFNINFRNNVISGWGGSGIEIYGPGGTRIKNLTLADNEVQNLVDASYLVEIAESSATSEIHSGDNTFHSGPMAANNWFLVGNNNKSIDGYKTAVSDSTSLAKQVNYPNGGATIGGYSGSLGKPATHEAFIAEARKQSRDYWRTEYTSYAVNAWIRAAFGK